MARLDPTIQFLFENLETALASDSCEKFIDASGQFAYRNTATGETVCTQKDVDRHLSLKQQHEQGNNSQPVQKPQRKPKPAKTAVDRAKELLLNREAPSKNRAAEIAAAEFGGNAESIRRSLQKDRWPDGPDDSDD